MAYPVADAFNRTTATPRFSDEVFDTLTDRDAYASGLRYEGLLVYVKEDQTSYRLKGGVGNEHWVVDGGGTGGSGGGSFEWFTDGPAPIEENEFTRKVYLYQKGLSQNLYAVLNVPDSYSAGDQIKLKVKFYSPDTSGDAWLTANTLLANPEDTADSTTNVHVAVNSDVDLSVIGVAYTIYSVEIDLTDSDGEINGVPVEPGATLTVQLHRGGDTATSDIRFIKNSAEVIYGD